MKAGAPEAKIVVVTYHILFTPGLAWATAMLAALPQITAYNASATTSVTSVPGHAEWLHHAAGMACCRGWIH
jgi:hypothetical protein